MDIGSLQVHLSAQGNAHFTSPLGPGGLQHAGKAVSQRFKVNGLLEVRRAAQLLAVILVLAPASPVTMMMGINCVEVMDFNVRQSSKPE